MNCEHDCTVTKWRVSGRRIHTCVSMLALAAAHPDKVVVLLVMSDAAKPSQPAFGVSLSCTSACGGRRRVEERIRHAELPLWCGCEAGHRLDGCAPLRIHTSMQVSALKTQARQSANQACIRC